MAVPRLRQGPDFPDCWWSGAEAAMVIVVATCYLLGVSTRRMEWPLRATNPKDMHHNDGLDHTSRNDIHG